MKCNYLAEIGRLTISLIYICIEGKYSLIASSLEFTIYVVRKHSIAEQHVPFNDWSLFRCTEIKITGNRLDLHLIVQ